MQIEKNTARRDEEHMEWEQERYKAALNAKYGKAPLKWEYGKGDWKRLRDQHIANLSVLDQDPRTTLSYDLQGLRLSELQLRDKDGLPSELQLRDTHKAEVPVVEDTERRVTVLPEVLNLFRKSESRWLWLRKMYDSVFPENTEKLEEDAWKEELNRRRLAQHRRIWQSVALGKATPQTKRAYQDPKPAPLLHMIYGAPKRITLDAETWDYVPWKGKSRFSDLASAEDRAQCYPADFSITHVSGFSETDQPVREENAEERLLRQASALAWKWKWDGLPLLKERYNSEGVSQGNRIGRISGAVSRYGQDGKGFGKKFFEMPLDETDIERDAQLKRLKKLEKKRQKALKSGDSITADKLADTKAEVQVKPFEGESFLPSNERELGLSDATLVFDITTSTFYLQKVKQKKKAVLRGKVLRKERKRADAKLPLFSLSALEKGDAEELLKLWKTVTEKVQYLREWKLASDKFTGAKYLRENKELMQRFLHLAVKFCSQQAAASIQYNPAVSLSAHRRMNLEEQERMICNSSKLNVTEDYAEWVARAYALLMLPAETRGSVRGLGWPDQRYWEPFRDADGRSPASASPAKEWKEDQEEQVIETKGYTISTTHRKPRIEELRTAADQSRADDWEGSEQQEISSLST